MANQSIVFAKLFTKLFAGTMPALTRRIATLSNLSSLASGVIYVESCAQEIAEPGIALSKPIRPDFSCAPTSMTMPHFESRVKDWLGTIANARGVARPLARPYG